MVVKAVVTCPEPEHSYLLLSVRQVAVVSPAAAPVPMPPLAVLLSLENDLHLRLAGRQKYPLAL